MSNILEQYEKVKSGWKNESKIIPYNTSKKALFAIAYHASNDVPFRCIHILIKEGDEDVGNEAVIFSSLEKVFIELLGKEEGLEIKVYNESGDFSRLSDIETKLTTLAGQFNGQSEEIQKQIVETILVERKMDEVVNLTTIKALARKVYYAIGEARERGALIQMMMSAPKVDLVQMAMMKWMNAALNAPQDEPFPKANGLIKNFLQLKKWIMDLINKSFTASEEELLPKGKGIDEE
jgi:hypothetical protein